MLDFGRQKLHFIQIGLGSNSTFIQNLAGTKAEYSRVIYWLLQAIGEHRPEEVRGVSVEPVKDLVKALESTASWLPNVQLLHAAMGETEESGAEMQGLSPELRDDLLEQAPPSKRAKLNEDLEYVRNMSCFGGVHPYFPMCKRYIEFEHNVTIGSTPFQKVDIWTWAKLAETLNFEGCEVVVIDTEGYDTKILRSMISYCREHDNAWPDLIQFETMGHCDRHEGLGSEWRTIRVLEKHGYTVVALSDQNSQLVRKAALFDNQRLQEWIGEFYCYACWEQWACPYISLKKGIFCNDCYDFFVGKRFMKRLNMGRKLDDIDKPMSLEDYEINKKWIDDAWMWRTYWRGVCEPTFK